MSALSLSLWDKERFRDWEIERAWQLFEILGVDKQMFISCGQDEPYRSPKKAYFSCVIGLYFLSFFYEHPVYMVRWQGNIVIIYNKQVYSSNLERNINK